ncbi:unnamed protein product [Rotaria magnacalcarata]|uniref:AIG1-type G domain-containing protein n=1 Tax=Rotaria magnacalcarata TaxID=392030 RepID=A0A816ZTB6_9BILA|nr:unnamed protein product [Rotaria magnacalcarata]CAF4191741.1 unnamed protein product [Rotaria magnacalcarata]
MALVIQEAAVVIYFMTPKYQDYPVCKNELQYASDLRKPMISYKSSLSNTILGKKQFDLSASCYSTIGDKCKVGLRYLHQQQTNLVVIATPGFIANENDIKRSIQIPIAKGAFAILLALSLELGLTNQEKKIIDTLTDIYGENIFQYIIIVFVCLDKIDGDLQTFIHQQYSFSSKAFFERCGNRFVDINNNANTEDKNTFVSNLINITKEMSPLA